MSFNQRTAVIIGGSSGIGFSVARKIIEGGGRVVIGARSKERLARAQSQLGNNATAFEVDNRDKHAIERLFNSIENVDYLFTPGANYARGPIDEISDEVAESAFKSKFWGQYWAVKHALPKLKPSSSIVLMSGIWSVRPPAGAAAYSACNAAIEGLGRALAVEIAPIRVNVVAPGTANTDLWENYKPETRNELFKQYAKSVPLARVGTTDEIADAVVFLMTNKFMTGSTLYVDGGFTLR